jgi:serine/threonine protein kinase
MSFDSAADTEAFVLSPLLSNRQYSTMPYLHVRTPRSAKLQNSRFSTDASPYSIPVPSADLPSIEPDLILTSMLGRGAAGFVFLGVAEDGSQYAVKVATSKEGKKMLSNEAFIYDRLSELQGERVPQVFGLWRCTEFDALVMEFVGRTAERMEDLSVAQRCVSHINTTLLLRYQLRGLTFIRSYRRGLYVDLCHIHENGVEHGDVRPCNVAIPEASKPRFIDFSHSDLHDCEGPESCGELLDAYEILLLHKSQSEPSSVSPEK